MNKFIITLLSTTIVVAAAYTACWFKESADIKSNIEQNIVAFNEKQKNINLHYDALIASGFPTAINFELIKPVVSINANELYNKEGQNINQSNHWLMEAKIDNLTLSSNILANNFVIKSIGQSEFKSIFNNQLQSSFVTNYEKPYSCNLTIANQDGLAWNVGKSFADSKAFFSAFRSINCFGENGITKDAKTGAVLHSVDKTNILISSEPSGYINQKIGLLVDVKNFKATPEFDKFFSELQKLFYAGMGNSTVAREQDVSVYGNNNVLIDLQYNGPIDKEKLYKSYTNVNFDLNSFNIKNDITDTQTNLHFSTSPKDSQRESSIVMHSKSDVNEKYDQILAKSIAQEIESFLKVPAVDSYSENLKNNLTLLGNPQDIANIITPKFHEFGSTTSNIDLNIKTQNGVGNPLSNSIVNLNSFEWFANQYGFKLNGNGAFGSDKPPTGNLSLNLKNGDNLINDLGGYLSRLESLWIKIQPHAAYVTTPLVEGTKKFLHDISDKNSKDISISLVADEKNMTISGKQVMEIIGLFGTDIGPYLPQPNAANK